MENITVQIQDIRDDFKLRSIFALHDNHLQLGYERLHIHT